MLLTKENKNNDFSENRPHKPKEKAIIPGHKRYKSPKLLDLIPAKVKRTLKSNIYPQSAGIKVNLVFLVALLVLKNTPRIVINHIKPKDRYVNLELKRNR